MTIETTNENILKQHLKEGVNLFLGSGFSTLAKDSNGASLPTSKQLCQELLTHFNQPKLGGMDLSRVCKILESSNKAELRKFLKQRFSVISFDSKYNYLKKISIAKIFTTNIDNLISRLYESDTECYINDVTIQGPNISDKNAVDYIPLHGSILRDSKLIFNPFDIASDFNTDRDKWHFFTEALQKNPTFFIGYGMHDAGVLEALTPETVRGRELKDRWILLRDSSDFEQEELYFEAIGFKVIKGELIDLFDFLQALDQTTPSSFKTSVTHLKFKEEIPHPDEVPVRPIKEFYLGAAPLWADIFSGKICKTKYYDSIVDSIIAQRHVIILGIPVSGKTTLLMQVASSFSTPVKKLFYNSISEEKAKLVLRKLNGLPALVFIDNFTDDMDAFNIFYKAKNIQIVAADRDYNFDIVSHRIDQKKFQIINATSLNAYDMQTIYNNIPDNVRIDKYKLPQVEDGAEPSIFEVVESNIVYPVVRERFSNMLQDLSSQKELHDLLVMCCYVHSCRTPVSFDMAFSFLRDKVSGYQEVYKLLESVGSLIIDFSGEYTLMDGEQDHYIPRSSIFSNTILSIISPNDLKSVITQFHTEVTPFRICRYDIFKRRAYDANLISRAFNDWKEGMDFYTTINSRDESPFVLQQGALYLSNKSKFKESFLWIDDALVLSKNKIFSIRNTHAVILFKANINMYDDSETVRSTLNQSMEILSECYLSDKRKVYHALTFADFALKYNDKYGDEQSHEYMRKAYEWLQREHSAQPWHRGISRLYRIYMSRMNRH
ncbi:MAG: SIR2 family protein [Pseudodesulfovibrio sp.]|uniref:P-loop NTPase n=1 Tax=Pseudodesulfovibrio sp. TaxID=2035812 RepID=UPI003D0F6E26